MDRTKYPPNWPEISRAIRERAGHRCECTGDCDDAHEGGRCGAPSSLEIVRDPRDPRRFERTDSPVRPCAQAGCARPATFWEHDGRRTCFDHASDRASRPFRVVLGVAHLDQDPSHGDPARLKALCARCHLRVDRFDHARKMAATVRARTKARAARAQAEAAATQVLPEIENED